MAKKILLIEDEKILGEMYTTRLEKEGFSVERVVDAENGIELAKTSKPDLILLDLLLPKMSGSEALYVLKENPETKDIKVIIFTNYDTPEIRSQTEKLDARFILKANVAAYQLVDIIREEIDRK